MNHAKKSIQSSADFVDVTHGSHQLLGLTIAKIYPNRQKIKCVREKKITAYLIEVITKQTWPE